MNHFAIVVCAVSIFLLGAPWYSTMLFGRAWGKANGTPIEQKQAAGGGHAAMVYVIAFVMAWVAAYAFAALIGPQPTIHHALHHGLLCGGGIAATSFAINYQFANRGFTLLLIDAGYHIVQFVLYGVILGLWH